ncbi:MAG: dihydropteroate synthase [Muribaculaceae bacterium]|nr:dihydropteroate synthase [Muribaculaceae bacterium]
MSRPTVSFELAGGNDYTLRCGRGELIDFERPKVMGIINVTPDSFYSGSRVAGEEPGRRCEEMLRDGVDMIDVGGYSSRPGCEDVSPDEEWRRLREGLSLIREVAGDEVIISVDTFRSDVARRCVEEFGVNIINDISGGMEDEEMFGTVAQLGVAYVLMHLRGTVRTMAQYTDYEDVTAEVIGDLAFKLARLRQLGVADVIVDPGFGFSKTIEGNFELMKNLPEFQRLGCPVLAGISRKSMIWKSLGITPEDSLNGTTALNMASLLGGADILRVHDVKAAVETVELFMKIRGTGV